MLVNNKMVRYLRYTIVCFTLVLVYLFVTQKQNVSVENTAEIPKRQSRFKSTKCQNYVEYANIRHAPFSEGPLKLPFQRPDPQCRTYSSKAVEKVIEDMRLRIKDPDLMRLFENCLPNTLDTTILWHYNSTQKDVKHIKDPSDMTKQSFRDFSLYTQSFIVTGDIHAEWLRDSAWQLSAYIKLANYDAKIRDLLIGAINTQARYIVFDPYCNAFQPPPESKVNREKSAVDSVMPAPNWRHVFECKYEVDSLASFLQLTNSYYETTQDKSIFTSLWRAALETVMVVLERETLPTFDQAGRVLPFKYTFQRNTNIGSETLPLTGNGNPVNYNTHMVRSAFRPSDDACIFQLFIPGNAFLATEMFKLGHHLQNVSDFAPLSEKILEKAAKINESIYEFGVFEHPEFGTVFAYETDGYNSALFMDDANIPSLLSLPDLGFIDANSTIYKNTRKMILTKRGNPYYLFGRDFRGIGGPHVGFKYAWPMSLLVKIRTSDDDDEIELDLKSVLRSTGRLGLMHEGINVNSKAGTDFTRPWFAWCNSELGKTILDLAQRKPHLIFNDEYKNTPYVIEKEFKGVHFD